MTFFLQLFTTAPSAICAGGGMSVVAGSDGVVWRTYSSILARLFARFLKKLLDASIGA